MMLVLVGCTNDECAGTVSYSLDMLRNFAGQAICESCYTDGEYGKEAWGDLPVIMPHDLTFYWPNQQPKEFTDYLASMHELIRRVGDLRKVMGA